MHGEIARAPGKSFAVCLDPLTGAHHKGTIRLATHAWLIDQGCGHCHASQKKTGENECQRPGSYLIAIHVLNDLSSAIQEG
jgi:cbb3-type cytochrome oxidase cytochrome c subunit